ncbi:MAG: protease complex subunit PrcB family protein [Cellvibrionaceae bacterium]
MKILPSVILFSAIFSTAVISGCNSTTIQKTKMDAVKSANAQLIYSSQYCQTENLKPNFRYLTDNNWQKFKSASFSLQESPKEESQPVPTESTLLLISMGSQPNTGYNLGLSKASIQIFNSHSQLAIDWNTPQPGHTYGQAITSPCLIIGIPKAISKNYPLKIINSVTNQELESLNRF